MGSVEFILRLMKELGNFMQRISMSQCFPTSRAEASYFLLSTGNGEKLISPFLITAASSRMKLPGWHGPSGVWRCDTVQWSEHQGFTVLKLFMASVKSDGRSDRVSLSSIKSVRNCERAAKSNNNLPAVWNPVKPDEMFAMYISETNRPLAHFRDPIPKLFKALKEFGYCGDCLFLLKRSWMEVVCLFCEKLLVLVATKNGWNCLQVSLNNIQFWRCKNSHKYPKVSLEKQPVRSPQKWLEMSTNALKNVQWCDANCGWLFGNLLYL